MHLLQPQSITFYDREDELAPLETAYSSPNHAFNGDF